MVAAVRLAIVGMGKCGARELNYISDVDVMYVVGLSGCRPGAAGAVDEVQAVAVGNALAAALSQTIYAPEREPGLWEVDANLRPEGKDGPLVRTLDSYLAYYHRWAQSWEFQALLKARTIAGDQALGREFEAGRVAADLGILRTRRLCRIRAGHAPARHSQHPRRRRRTARSSWARAACAMLNSPSSCCSWSTARTIRASASAPRRQPSRP